MKLDNHICKYRGIDRDNAVVGRARFGEMLPRNRMEHERGTCSSIQDGSRFRNRIIDESELASAVVDQDLTSE